MEEKNQMREEIKRRIHEMTNELQALKELVDSEAFAPKESELTEFEMDLLRCIVEHLTTHIKDGNSREMSSTVFIDDDTAKEIAEDVFDLAKKELCGGCTKCIDEYWRGRKEGIEECSRPVVYTYPYLPSCYHGGLCTNPMHDCINCPRQSTGGFNTTTGTSTSKVEG